MAILYKLFEGHLNHFNNPIPLSGFPFLPKHAITCPNSKLMEKDKEACKNLCDHATKYVELEPDYTLQSRHVVKKNTAAETSKQKSNKKKARKNLPQFTKATTVKEAFTVATFI